MTALRAMLAVGTYERPCSGGLSWNGGFACLIPYMSENANGASSEDKQEERVDARSIWEDLERRIKERGVRVEQRLALLARLRETHADGGDIAAALDELSTKTRNALNDAAARLLKEVRG
jgi:hypothetical protein